MKRIASCLAAIFGVLFIRPSANQPDLRAMAQSNVPNAQGVDALDAGAGAAGDVRDRIHRHIGPEADARRG